jgi:hypothetical protein
VGGVCSRSAALLRQPKRRNPDLFATGRADSGAIAVRAPVLVRVERHVFPGAEASGTLAAAATFRTPPPMNTFTHDDYSTVVMSESAVQAG